MIKFEPHKYFGINEIFQKSKKDESITFLSEEHEKERIKKFNDLKENYSYKKELSEEHVQFLDRIIEDENKRQGVIEGKLGQIIGQSGLIFTLIALFAPFFYDKLSGLAGFWKISILVLFILGCLFFLLSIFHATKSFNIRNFIYSRPNVGNVLNEELDDKDKFIQKTVQDLITGIPINIKTNSSKGNLLLYAQRSFTVGFVSISVLALIVTSSFIFHASEEKIFFMKSTDEINRIQNVLNNVSNIINEIKLTTISKEDSLRLQNLDLIIDEINDSLKSVKIEFEDKILQLTEPKKH